MTVKFSFPAPTAPHIELGAHRTWGGFSATLAEASAGRHILGASLHHRILFYNTGPVEADCSCDGIRQQRLQMAGDFDLVPAGAEGWWEDRSKTEIVSVQVAPALVTSTSEAMALPSSRPGLTARLGSRDPQIAYLIQALCAELQSDAPAGRLYADALGLALTSRLLQTSATSIQRVSGRTGLTKLQLRRVIEFIDANLDQELNLPQIAQVAGLSVAYLTRLFRQSTGQTVHAYVMDRRVEEAKRLILTGDCPVAEIALQCGFAHQSHLASWMRRRLGITPSSLMGERQAQRGSRKSTSARR